MEDIRISKLIEEYATVYQIIDLLNQNKDKGFVLRTEKDGEMYQMPFVCAYVDGNCLRFHYKFCDCYVNISRIKRVSFEVSRNLILLTERE